MDFVNYLITQVFFNRYDPFGFEMLKDSVDVIEINKLLNKSKASFYKPEKDMIETYIRVFKLFQKKPEIYTHFFKISKVLPIDSANGRVFTMGFKQRLGIIHDDSQLIVKVPLQGGDSLSYEYYIGNVMNTLRKTARTPIFSLIYGRMMCGLNKIFEKTERDKDGRKKFVSIPQQLLDNETVRICDVNFKNNTKMHLLYEYVRNPNTKRVVSLESYINRLRNLNNKEDMWSLERNIMNILVILMYSLQVAYDTVQFTHYDLHAGNILVVELDEPEKFEIKYKRGQKISIISNVIPYVIDYGKCFVNPELAVPEEDGLFHEFETNYTFKKFSEFQKSIFGDWIIEYNEENPDDENSERVMVVDEVIDDYLNKIKQTYNYSNDKLNTMKIQIIDTIFNRYIYDGERENYDKNDNGSISLYRYDFGIHPRPNEKYDFFRLMNTVIDILYEDKGNNNTLEEYSFKYDKMWRLLKRQLRTEYPFYDPYYYSLPCDYHITDYNRITSNQGPWKHWIMKPSDIGKILYNIIKDDVYIIDSDVRVHQIGGNIKNQKKDNFYVKKMDRQFKPNVKTDDRNNSLSSYKDDFVEGVMDVGPVYIKYVESDLMKIINSTKIDDTKDNYRSKK